MISNIEKQFGLIGNNISYSFSKAYFLDKFKKENIENCSYENFDIQCISSFPEIIKNNPKLKGLNITIPYKEQILPYIDNLSKNAVKIGAINTIKFTKKGLLKGYNTDYYGFMKSIKPMLNEHHKKALILGTGGASKGVAFALKKLSIDYIFVSREAKTNTIEYNKIDQSTFNDYQIIINTTPLGTSPNINAFPLIPFEYFTKNHIAYDLIYNPAETQFLKKAQEMGAKTKNGQDMLIFQAEKSWKIWNK